MEIKYRAYSGILNLILIFTLFIFIASCLPGSAAATAFSFQEAGSYSAGNEPIRIITGDFNAGSMTDLAVINLSSNNVAVFLGDGSGIFAEGVFYSTGNWPRGIVAGDFNGSGVLDLAVTNSNSDSISIFTGNGDGTFREAVNYPTAGRPYGIAAGDFNNDGILDLAVTNFGAGSISIFAGKGDGTFEEPVHYPAGNEPHCIVAGDFNGSGTVDLAVTNLFSSRVSVLLNNGDGSFNGAASYRVGSNPFCIIPGDFNGSGVLDLAVTNRTSNTVSVLVGNGDGTFNEAVHYPVDSSPRRLTSGDFNNNGVTDLAVACSGSGTVSVLAGNGDGTFKEAVSFQAGSFPADVATGDFNNNGKLDLAAVCSTSGQVFILLNITPIPGEIHFSQAEYTVMAGCGPAVITVTRSGGSENAVTVDYTTEDGTAIDGEDYQAVSGTLTFEAGETSGTFEVIIFANEHLDGDRTVNLTLNNPTGGAFLGEPANAVLTIVAGAGTPDVTTLAVVSTHPGNGAYGIALNERISIFFNKDIFPGADFSGIVLKEGDSAVDYVYDIDGGSLSIRPVAGFRYDTLYTVFIPAGALEDNAGSNLATDYTFSFTTRDAPGGHNDNVPDDNVPVIATVTAAHIRGAATAIFEKTVTGETGKEGVLISNGALKEMNNLARKVKVVTPHLEVIISPQTAAELLKRAEDNSLTLQFIPGEALDTGRGYLQPAGTAVTVKASYHDGGIEGVPEGEILLFLPYQPDLAENSRNLVVYGLTGGAWSFIGGKPHGAYLSVSAELLPSATYALFENTRSFPDINAHWAADAVETLASRYIVSGMPGGYFAPGNPVTRAEFAAMAANVLDFAGLTKDNKAVFTGFDDVPEGAWYFTPVNKLQALGIASGYGDNTFRPDSLLSREETAVFTVRLLDYLGIDAPANDIHGGQEEWSMEKGERLWDEKLTRAGAAVIIKRVLEIAGLI